MRDFTGAAIAMIFLAVTLVPTGCQPSETASPSGAAAKLFVAGNLNNLYVVVSEGAGEQAGFSYWQRDASGLWHAGPGGKGTPAAVAAWRENLLVFFPTGRYGQFGLEPPVVQPAPVASWTPVAVCEDGLAADAFGWNAGGELVWARFEDSKWTSRRVEVSPLDREKMQDPVAVRFGARLYLVWREEVPTLTGPEPGYRVRFLYLDKDRWQGPVASRLRSASAPRVAADGQRMVCLFLKPAGDGGPGTWTLATYATADEDWHETATIAPPLPGGPVGFGRLGDKFLVVDMNNDLPQAAPIDLATGQLSVFAPVTTARPETVRAPFDFAKVFVMALAVLAGILLMASWRRARQEAGAVVATALPQDLVPAPILRRAGALAIDYLLLVFILLPILLAIWPDLAERMQKLEAMSLQQVLAIEGVRLALITLYFTLFEVLWGKTPGKRILGIEVRRDGDGGPVRLWQALVRNLLRGIDERPGVYLLGLAMIFLGPKPQRLGDRLGRTLVVMTPKPRGQGQAPDA